MLNLQFGPSLVRNTCERNPSYSSNIRGEAPDIDLCRSLFSADLVPPVIPGVDGDEHRGGSEEALGSPKLVHHLLPLAAALALAYNPENRFRVTVSSAYTGVTHRRSFPKSVLTSGRNSHGVGGGISNQIFERGKCGCALIHQEPLAWTSARTPVQSAGSRRPTKLRMIPVPVHSNDPFSLRSF